ncbi:kinase-like domain-containing protein [Aspergillus avenaceus]|uniref:cyclin-dependent kinase n=1 Tax=Aspergillus avenaceus TaxID=36643 RepID=A0A5N6TSX8_ASPAV|nr:kinase-like domain-containing protein [Aspergillus avenaceus]
MSSKSRWADEDPETEAIVARQKREKEEKRRAKAEKQRQLVQQQQQQQTSQHDESANGETDARPVKRRRLSNDPQKTPETVEPERPKSPEKSTLLQFPAQTWGPCGHITNFERLNHIEEGSYGWVSRAKDITTGEVVALKKLKMENSQDGFPVTGLREIHTLFEARHPHIVYLREIVRGTRMDEVFLVMDFLEHDLKTLLDDMREPFLPSEIKTLMSQILSGLDFLHSQWIMHRDLKTSNLLMSNRGEIKIADFGMARYYGDPPPKLTQLVVTLWYRSPELLLGADKYGTEIDMWSIGCIFGELLTKEPLLQGKNEVDQVSMVTPASLYLLGPRPTDTIADICLDRTSNTADMAGLPLSPQRQIPPCPTNFIRSVEQSTLTAAGEIPLLNQCRSAATVCALGAKPGLTAYGERMSLASVFP